MNCNLQEKTFGSSGDAGRVRMTFDREPQFNHPLDEVETVSRSTPRVTTLQPQTGRTQRLNCATSRTNFLYQSHENAFPPSCVPPSISRTRCDGWRENFVGRTKIALRHSAERTNGATPWKTFSRPRSFPEQNCENHLPFFSRRVGFIMLKEEKPRSINFLLGGRFSGFHFSRASQPFSIYILSFCKRIMLTYHEDPLTILEPKVGNSCDNLSV